MIRSSDQERPSLPKKRKCRHRADELSAAGAAQTLYTAGLRPAPLGCSDGSAAFANFRPAAETLTEDMRSKREVLAAVVRSVKPATSKKTDGFLLPSAPRSLDFRGH